MLLRARPPRKANHRPVYGWSIVANDLGCLLEAVVPYLKEKTEQALLLLALRQTMRAPRKGRYIDPTVRAERERLSVIFRGTRRVAW